METKEINNRLHIIQETNRRTREQKNKETHKKPQMTKTPLLALIQQINKQKQDNKTITKGFKTKK
ncbi:hypothetical protein EWF20_02835 [Sulfolobus sp. S-194]|uniref:hypothetical protein n=1 Tax=Sulfolobus sp. S-194 TaxID=2512240 RepID=UPI0014370457|nr:hypothetical protein [Sulfolobus sp. S-194]QIW23181.1 hypothetical protein EWF20_02835 [Sulfolobus sp. S-194]